MLVQVVLLGDDCHWYIMEDPDTLVDKVVVSGQGPSVVEPLVTIPVIMDEPLT
jgi:hypothetical protein